MNPRTIWGQVLKRADDFTIVTSPDTTIELMNVLHPPELKATLSRLSGRPTLDRVADLLASAELVRPSDIPRVCRDPGDDKFFACAVEGRADFIVSEDDDILAVGEYGGITTVTAEQFLATLDQA